MLAEVPHGDERVERHQQAGDEFEASAEEEGDERHRCHLQGADEIGVVEDFADESADERTQNETDRHKEQASDDANRGSPHSILRTTTQSGHHDGRNIVEHGDEDGQSEHPEQEFQRDGAGAGEVGREHRGEAQRRSGHIGNDGSDDAQKRHDDGNQNHYGYKNRHLVLL